MTGSGAMPEWMPGPCRPPERWTLCGRNVVLEPLAPSHAADLWLAMRDAGAEEAGFDFMSYGPFGSEAALAAQLQHLVATPGLLAWAVRPHPAGRAAGWMALLDIEPAHRRIELGHIWLARALRRSAAATEAMFLLLDAAARCGVTRLAWKCDAANTASRRAAERLGFRYEGTLRAHMIVKGRRRDTAYYSILASEWPRCREAVLAWLDAGNFDAGGWQRRSLRRIRDEAAEAASPVCYRDLPEAGWTS